jgi:hypothetical protein
VPAPPQTVVTEEKTYVTIRKTRETLALKGIFQTASMIIFGFKIPKLHVI